MKRLILTLSLACVIALAQAQVFEAPSKTRATFTDTTTTFTYKIQDESYKVCKSRTGAFYIWKTSKKTGKNYKMYLPKEIQEKMGRKYNK